MEQKTSLGSFEEVILLTLLRLGENAYGVTVRQTVEEVTGRSASIGAIYATLDRLEEKGYVSSRQGEATPERGGRAKRYFKLEGAGLAALREAELVRSRLTRGLNLGLASPLAQKYPSSSASVRRSCGSTSKS